MDPSATSDRQAMTIPKEYYLTSNTKQLVSRRTPSFTSPSSSYLSPSTSSFSTTISDEYSPPTPVTPLKLSGVPFSWEQLPGIPKKLANKIKDSAFKVLPLPPPANPLGRTPSKKNSSITNIESFRRDPFLAALVACSKGDDDDYYEQEPNCSLSSWNMTTTSNKVSRSLLTHKFGSPLGLHLSCKRTCAVSESIVYLPRSKYDLINRRSR